MLKSILSFLAEDEISGCFVHCILDSRVCLACVQVCIPLGVICWPVLGFLCHIHLIVVVVVSSS